MARRVVLGQQNDGTFGLRVSAPGVDAFAGDGQGADFTFNSAWTDIAKIHQVGVVSWSPTAYTNSNGITFAGFSGVWTDLGYKPFIEVRKLVGNVVYDDYWNAANPFGQAAIILSNQFQSPESSTTDRVIYIVYRIQAPVQGA